MVNTIEETLAVIEQAFRIGWESGRESPNEDREKALQEFIDEQDLERRSDRRVKL